MAQTTPLFSALKQALKARGFTYREVGKAIDLSEASIKRMFAEQQLSVQRLDQICQLMNMEISDLVKLMEAQEQQITELTEAQEQELVADTKMLLVAFLVVNGWQFEEICTWYEIGETEAIRYLARLDRLDLIELLPNNRIRLRISPKFRWRQNGPIQKFFTTHLQDDFLNNQFDDQRELFQFPTGMLSRASSEQFKRRLQQLIQDFYALHEQDRNLPLEKRHGCSLFLAFRPWRPEAFEQFRRK